MNRMKALRQYQKVSSVAQTSEASPHRLVQMLMEAGLDHLAKAKGALSRGQIAQKGIMLGRAIEMIGGLRAGLDPEKSGGDPDSLEDLDALYAYMMQRLGEANLKSDPEMIDEVARLLITVKSGWDAIATVE
jgi:flagellar protein FliS